MKIRIARDADALAMHGLAAGDEAAAHWNIDAYERVFVAPNRMAFVAETRGGIVGFVVAHQVADEWEIENLVVALRERRRGIGTALLARTIATARAGSARRMLLEVRESNDAARTMYRRLGFVESGRRPGYYSGPAENAVLLTLTLH